MAHFTKWVDGEPYNRCDSRKDFEKECRLAQFQSVEHFERATGVSFEELKGRWWTMTMNRVSVLA